MSNRPVQNEPNCPLCGGANRCAVARSGGFDTPCWCARVAFSSAWLNRVAPARRGLACLCPACAAAAPAATPLAPATAIAEVRSAPNARGADCAELDLPRDH